MPRFFALIAELPEGVDEMTPFDLSHDVIIDDPVHGRIPCWGLALEHADEPLLAAARGLISIERR